MVRKVRKILEKVPEKVLQQDLEKYRQRALELGATDAKIITTDMIVIDERVRAKCIYPKCRCYGTNASCPPYSMDVDLTRKIVKNFRYAILLKREVPPEEMAGPEVTKSNAHVRSSAKNHEIISKIESEAFYDGYHLALGFANGACKAVFCPDKDCSALVPGQGCRHPLQARASMEGVGMDVFTMAAKVGWDIYPIGVGISPADVPYGSRVGLVLIY